MELFRSASVGRHTLDYHLERANVLAGNVANVDTPGFRPRELVRPDAEPPRAVRVPLARSDDAHLDGPRRSDVEGFELLEEDVVHPGNDGNGVSLEHELAKTSANQLRYESVARIVQVQLGHLRYAANDGNG
jgi:flagellar basal-body rod protein FlgB